MRPFVRTTLVTLAAATGVLAAASLPAIGCASFDASTTATDGSAPSAEGSVATEGGSVIEAGGPDAGAAADASSTEVCTDLSADFAAWMSSPPTGGAMTSKMTDGLGVGYPGGSPQKSANWRLAIDPGSSTGIRVRIDANIELLQIFSTSPAGYAGFAGIAHGDVTELGTAASLVVALGAFDTSKLTFDVDLFRNGLGGEQQPQPVASFAKIGVGSSDVSVTFDLVWSTNNAANLTAQLGDAGTAVVVAPTLATSGAGSQVWTLFLGGSAKDNNDVVLLYKRVCVTLH